jgi:DNA-binding beta-propeller fold protein YncE
MKIAALILLGILAAGTQAQVLDSRTYATTGHPTEAVVTPDGQYILVTVNRGQGNSGIDVFRDTGKKLDRIAFQPLGGGNAQGILLIPHSGTLAVGLSNAGVAFLPLADALQGKAEVRVLPQGPGSGTGYLALTPDAQILFAANEYGEGGNIGVILLHPDSQGHIHPQAAVHLPAGQATPGVAVSPDGTRVYAVGELIPPTMADRLPGHDNPELRRDGCTQGQGRTTQNGALYVLDTQKVAALPADAEPADIRGSRIGWTDAGCSPVRAALTADGSRIYVTARGDNRILAFDTARLTNTGAPALAASFASGGEAPVGVKLFNNDRNLLVANSNRFNGGNGNASVFDLSDPAKPVLQQTIKTGEFPRNISTSPDGRTLYLTIFLSDQLMVLRPKQ